MCIHVNNIERNTQGANIYISFAIHAYLIKPADVFICLIHYDHTSIRRIYRAIKEYTRKRQRGEKGNDRSSSKKKKKIHDDRREISPLCK